MTGVPTMTGVPVECPYRFALELSRDPEGSGIPLAREEVDGDLASLVEEAYVRGICSEALPEDGEIVACRVTPRFSREPIVERLDVDLEVRSGGALRTLSLAFRAGRWVRRSLLLALRLREEGTVGADETVYRALVAESVRGEAVRGEAEPVDSEPAAGASSAHRLPVLQPPRIVAQSLEDAGVRELGEGSLESDRPVLVSENLVRDVLDATVRAGPRETGGAVLGKLIRLPAPLPGTDTRVVTLLSCCLCDDRHVGEASLLSFSPESLAEAFEIARVRARGESVVSVFHSHGWGTDCGRCNENRECTLPECTAVSVTDYQMVETLLPSKATLVPIAGRKLGAGGEGPVLEIHAWRGGELRPLRWQQYRE